MDDPDGRFVGADLLSSLDLLTPAPAGSLELAMTHPEFYWYVDEGLSAENLKSSSYAARDLSLSTPAQLLLSGRSLGGAAGKISELCGHLCGHAGQTARLGRQSSLHLMCACPCLYQERAVLR